MTEDNEVKVLDVVALLESVPAKWLRRGQVGTVVEEWEPGAYEVEFSNEEGIAQAFAALRAEQIMVLHHNYAASTS